MQAFCAGGRATARRQVRTVEKQTQCDRIDAEDGYMRDFFYNKNDIILALLILLASAGVICWRVYAIMTYLS